MKCSNCGTEVGENDVFCPICGTRIKDNGGNTVQINKEEVFSYDRPFNQPTNNNVQGNNPQNFGQSNTYSQQHVNNSGNGNIVKIFVIIIIILSILAAVVFVANSIVSAINKNQYDSAIVNDPSSEIPSTTTQTTNNGFDTPNPQTSTNGDGTTTSYTQRNTSTYKVNFSGFKLYIPDNLIYHIGDTFETIDIGDALSTWVAQLSIQELPYQQLKQNKSSLSNYFSEFLSSYNANATISNATVENIDGIEYIIMEASIAGTNEIMAIAELNSMYSAFLEVINENNDFDRSVLNNLTSIINTAEFDSNFNSLEVKEHFDIKDINKALTKAIEEK